MKKCLIIFGEYRGRRKAIEWDSENLPDDWDSILSTWSITHSYSYKDGFSDTKHRTIIEPCKIDDNLFLYPSYAMSNRIIKALESINEEYEYIVVKRLDLLWKDVFTHISDIQNKIWVEEKEEKKTLNDYIFAGKKDELLYFFKSVYNYIETNNPPRMKNGLPYVHYFWYKMVKKYISYEPNELFIERTRPKYNLLRKKKF
jgi:hypothetical protein